MSERIGIKFFKEKNHKEMFDSGQLYSRHISYYREQEAELGDGRGDSNEGLLECNIPTRGLSIQTSAGDIIKPLSEMNVSMPILEDQHIFSFMVLREKWCDINKDVFHFRIPEENSRYFIEKYGRYYSIFNIDKLINALKKTDLPGGEMAYFTHFKVDYVDDETLKSPVRFNELNELMDRIEKLENNYAEGKLLLDLFLKQYMGLKSRSHSLENEMRIVLGIFSKEPNVLTLDFKAI